MATETEATFVSRWWSTDGTESVEVRQTRRVVLLWPEDLWWQAQLMDDVQAVKDATRQNLKDYQRAQRRKEGTA